MSSSSSKEEGAEPGTYAELTREPAQDGSGEWTYKAITNREAMQADPGYTAHQLQDTRLPAAAAQGCQYLAA
ncbi:hypothetical protein [Vreelandella aquamarina]|uniref:hypothetical protein n=1 Tax=Vreelandella aquamarina TaxID=77097 RepID=UPI00385111EE